MSSGKDSSVSFVSKTWTDFNFLNLKYLVIVAIIFLTHEFRDDLCSVVCSEEDDVMYDADFQRKLQAGLMRWGDGSIVQPHEFSFEND